MSVQSDSGLTPIPDDFRLLTWEIGKAELQKSVMARETFEALKAGKTNVVGIRTVICRKRKLYVYPSRGKWTETASDRFVNEHAWVLAKMNEFGMIPKVNSQTGETALLPGAGERLQALIAFFESNEPFEWKPGLYKKAPGW